MPSISIRTTLLPGDLGSIVAVHGLLYAREYGFDHTFEAYVAGPLAEFVRAGTLRERLWIAEKKGEFAGSIAIVAATAETAQLRWFLVEPSARGKGLGRRLLDNAVAFSRDCGYQNIILWTVSALTAAARLYQAAGFVRVEAKPGSMWGVNVIEEKYQLTL